MSLDHDDPMDLGTLRARLRAAEARAAALDIDRADAETRAAAIVARAGVLTLVLDQLCRAVEQGAGVPGALGRARRVLGR